MRCGFFHVLSEGSSGGYTNYTLLIILIVEP